MKSHVLGSVAATDLVGPMSFTIVDLAFGARAVRLNASPSPRRHWLRTIPRSGRTRAAVMLLVGVLTAVSAISGLGATREEERAKGEEMLQKAQQDLLQARQLHEGATRALQTAHKEQATADQRTQEARVLIRDAFLLIRDPNRMRAAELRATADTKELQARNAEVEIQRLQVVAAHHKKVAEDSTNAVVRIQDAAKNEPNPAQKAQLTKMAESVSKEGATASAELALVERNIATVDADRKRLYSELRTLRAEAQTLDPIKK